MMAEMVSSAVVQETVSQVLSILVHKCKGKEILNAYEDVERLEMAHIRLEAALEMSSKWLITDASLLRWRKKLKHAAQECDDVLQKCKQRILEENHIQKEVRNSSFPKRIVHATKSFIFSALGSKNESSRSVVQRFEWFADGASEFMRFVELGGTPCRHMPIKSIIKHLLDGYVLHHKIVRGDEYPLFLFSLVPFRTAEHGIEAGLLFIKRDGNAPEKNFFLSVMLQISESTDFIGTTIKCLQFYTALHFKSAVEIIREELTQLPMQEFLWVPYVDSCKKEHWDNLHRFSTQWFRPNPLCCKQRGQYYDFCHGSKVGPSRSTDISLESVIEVNLQCQVSLSEYNNQRRNSMLEGKICLQDSSHLKAGLLFMPHGSSDDLLPADRSSALVTVDRDEQRCLYTDIALEQLAEVMLPEAVEYFSRNTRATAYQMLWKSKRGTAYVQVEKESISMPGGTRGAFPGVKKRKLLQRREELGNPINVISRFIDLWATQAPIQLQGPIMEWSQKEKENRLARLAWMDEGNMDSKPVKESKWSVPGEGSKDGFTIHK